MKDIPGFEGLYAADKKGGIWSRRTGKRLKPYENTGGYLRVKLYKDGEASRHYVHQLIAKTFLPNPNGGTVVNHKNTNVKNNWLYNLEWCSQKENIEYSRALGNQYKDIPIVAKSAETGERRQYLNIRSASRDLFGSPYRLQYHYQTKGRQFLYGGWEFEVSA